MNFITRKQMNRRTILRGAGAMVSLPSLDAMMPALTAQTKAAKASQRLGVVYIPHGAIMKEFTPAKVGADYMASPEMSTTLKALEPLKSYVNVYSGLAHHQADSLGDGSAAHERAPSPFHNGVPPPRPEGEAVKA